MTRGCRSLLIALSLAGIAAPASVAQEAPAPTGAPRVPKPVVFTTQDDHQQMLKQLGITHLRPGRNSNSNAPNPANYDEAQANPIPDLPPLLLNADGTKVATPEQWWRDRRPALAATLEREVYGQVPAVVPAVRWEVRATERVEVGGRPAVRRQVVGVVDNAACPAISVEIALWLTLPAEVSGPVPVLLSFGFAPTGPNPPGGAGRPVGTRPPSKEEILIRAGWGSATLNPTTVQDDAGGWQPRRVLGGGGSQVADPPGQPTGAGLTRGIIGLCNLGQPRRPEQWGALRAWAWGASRALDYLTTVPEVDAKRVGIAGVSRYGKAALVTLAFDQRFAAGLIASSGKGGTVPLRRQFGEAVENLTGQGEYHWMAGNFLRYGADEPASQGRAIADLPVDSHATLALCAPRLTFVSAGVPERGDALWLDNPGSFRAAIAAQPVFRLLGARDLGRSDDPTTERMPAVKVGLLDGALAWRQHDGGHTDGPNVESFVRWADAHWPSSGASTPPASPATPPAAAPAPSLPAAAPAPRPEVDQRSLREAARGRYPIGVGVGHQSLVDPANVALIERQFAILTPENCMKPQSIHPAEDRWNFDAADRFAAFARDHQLAVVGHCLVWAKDDRTDEWLKREGDGLVTRETLLRRIDAHVRTVVGRYADVATMWDVVNEALADSGDALLRDSVYSRTSGIDFLVTAFRAARAADPDALLIYNDYNDNKPEKRRRVVELLTQLKAAGAPVDAYGMQGHFELGENLITDLRATFEALRKLGVKVVVSELDIDMVPRTRWWADGGKYRAELSQFNPYPDGLPPALAQQQADQYASLFRLFDEYRDIIARVSFWNLHDGESWLNDFPWHRANYPLLFDRQRQPKPAFDAVYAVLQSDRAPAPAPAPAPRPAAPHAAVERRDANSQAAHQQLLLKTRQGRIDLAFVGDSLTRRWGATDYPHLLAHWRSQFHGWNAANFGWGGDTTHNILWRLQNGELAGTSPRVVVVLAGTNNLPNRDPASPAVVADVVAGVKAIVAQVRTLAPQTTIVVLGLFPRPNHPALAPALAEINTQLAQLADGKSVRYLDIGDQLVDSSGQFRPGFSTDGLHIEQPGYEVWASALRPILLEVLGPPGPTDEAPPATGNPAQPRPS